MNHAPSLRPLRATAATIALIVLALVLGLVAVPAQAQDDPSTRQQPPRTLESGKPVRLEFFETDLGDVIKYMFEVRGENYIMGETNAFKEKVTIVSQKPVSPAAAWQAFLSALEVSGYTLVRTGGYYKIIKANEAVQAPLTVRSGDQTVPYSDQVITQLLPLDNISVGDVQSVVNALKSRNGNIIAYQPTNTLIVTDHAYNVRKIYQVVNELDIGAPRADMAIIQLKFADANEVKTIIEQLYAVGAESTSSSAQQQTATTRRRRRAAAEPTPPTNAGSVTAGKQANYIDKVMADQRTNSLIVLANDAGMAAVRKLVDQLDVDATDNSRSRIYVVPLEQAKAQDVVDVLSRLSEGGGGSSSTSRAPTRTTTARAGAQGAAPSGNAAESYGAIAAFDSGMRIAHDESTNSLVIIASPEDFFIVKSVIDELDRVRKQVFVDAVILEISSDDSQEFGISGHLPQSPASDALGFLSAQMGPSSLGLTSELLSGVALGVFGPDSPLIGPDGNAIPMFGVVLQAIKTYSGVEIVSNPNLMTLDNAEAKIVVGRKVPFPTNTSFNNLGQPIVTFTREDVAVSLELTPRINSENYVTLEVRVEVSEVEEDDSGLDPLLSGGPVTSKREVETTTLVKNNQTVVLGGLVGTTETEVETKVPILGDVPLIGALFRGQRKQSRKSNLLIFLTPHIIETEDDMLEVMRVKEAQFREFRRRFYGKSREAAYEEIRDLLQFSMNMVDRESMYRGSTNTAGLSVGSQPLSEATRDAVRTELDRAGNVVQPGANAGELPGDTDDDLAVPVDDPAAPDDDPLTGEE